MSFVDARYWAKEIFNSYVVPNISEIDCEEDYGYAYIPENGDLLEEVVWDNDKRVVDLYTITPIYRFGGEDCGSEYRLIYKLTIRETGESFFIKYEGDYSSWSEVSNWRVALVKPVEKIITVYEEIV